MINLTRAFFLMALLGLSVGLAGCPCDPNESDECTDELPVDDVPDDDDSAPGDDDDSAVVDNPFVEGDTPGECSDEVDNDGNGFTDCEDQNCAADPACAGGDDDDSAGDDDDATGDDDDATGDDDDATGDDDDATGDDDDSAGDDDDATGDDDDATDPPQTITCSADWDLAATQVAVYGNGELKICVDVSIAPWNASVNPWANVGGIHNAVTDAWSINLSAPLADTAAATAFANEFTGHITAGLIAMVNTNTGAVYPWLRGELTTTPVYVPAEGLYVWEIGVNPSWTPLAQSPPGLVADTTAW